jgi:hypothetical protein
MKVYKYAGGSWKEIYPNNKCNGITNVSLSGNTLTFQIKDNSECDLDPTTGKIVDPIVIGSEIGSGNTPGGGGASDTLPPSSSPGNGSGGCSMSRVSSDTSLLIYVLILFGLAVRRLRMARSIALL